MKSFVFCLLSVVFAIAASAQQTVSPRSNLLGNRMNRPLRPTPRPTATSASQAAAAAPGTSIQAPGASTEAGGRSIEFNGAPVDMVFTVYQDLVGKTVLKDPQTPAATITLQPRKGQELTDEEKIEAIETVLEMNGIHMEPYGEKFVRALPRKDVRKDGIPLILDAEAPLGESTRVVSLMIPFKNITVEEAQKALEGFKSNSGILLVFERTNAILVTDTEQIINRMREIARLIDVASPVTEVVEYIQIKYASAQDVKTVIDNIVQESMKEQEKNGKTPQNNAQQNQAVRPLLGGLRRPGQQNQQQQTPANNESLVMTVSDADRGMIRGKVVTIADERSNKILLITNASNMKFFKEVIAALDVETTPDTVVKVYRLKYAEAEDVSDMINDLIGNSSSSKSGGKANQNQASKTGTSGSVTRGNQSQAKKPANQRTGDVKAGELNKDNTTVLADKRINGLVVMTNKELVPTIEQIIESMDIKLSQVLIETVIIEVTLGDELSAGMDWVQHGREKVPADMMNAKGEKMCYVNQKVTKTYDSESGGGSETSESVISKLVPESYSREYSTSGSDSKGSWTATITEAASDVVGQTTQISRDGFLNYYTAGTATAIAGGEGGEKAYNFAHNITSNILGNALNFVFTSDELGLTAILQATKTDSRSKYIASPVIMTLDNKEATIDATSSMQFLTGWTANSSGYQGSGMPSPNYTSKDIGIKVKVTPKINPNGTVMLNVEEEYTQVAGTQTMLAPSGVSYVKTTIDVPTSRKMESDVILENNQTVVFGGLTQTQTREQEKGIPILKDIPFIGKWLFGTVEQTESRTELLVFMTPYVLNDAQAAQAEAIRRKKALSDPRAWDDHGWSLSTLADPVSQKEQMRRLKDEWKKQDEERQTKAEIEKAKLERAKKLQEMSKEERDRWLKLHKEELEEEKQDELEEKMLDEKSQEELKKLAAQVRKTKLAEANREIKAAEEEAKLQNERGKLDAEKEAEKKAEAEKKETGK